MQKKQRGLVNTISPANGCVCMVMGFAGYMHSWLQSERYTKVIFQMGTMVLDVHHLKKLSGYRKRWPHLRLHRNGTKARLGLNMAIMLRTGPRGVIAISAGYSPASDHHSVSSFWTKTM